MSDQKYANSDTLILLGELRGGFKTLAEGQSALRDEVHESISAVHKRVDECVKNINELRTSQAVSKTKLGALILGIIILATTLSNKGIDLIVSLLKG